MTEVRLSLGLGFTGTQLSVDVAPAGVGLKMAMRPSDEERSALEGLIAEIRAAMGSESA
jgi:hypothetical protein